MKLKALSIAVTVGLLGLLWTTPQTPTAQAVIATCPGDYYGFIFTAQSVKTSTQGLFDFIKLGFCQLSDIMALKDQLDQVRDSMRTAANSCEDTSAYKTQYTELLMEEYFVRNIQKNPSDVINEVDREKLKALKQVKLDSLETEMKALFVTKEHRTDETTFKTYFDGWASKYDDRIANYAFCEEGPYAELTATVQKFVDDMKKLSINVKTSGYSFSAVPKVTGLDKAKKDMSTMGQSIKNSWSFVKEKEELLMAAIHPATTPDDLSKSDKPMSFQEVWNALDGSDQDVTFQTNAAQRMANYEILYGAGSGVAATNMQSIVIYMNQIIDESNIKDFPKITAGAAKVYAKQCN